MASKRRLRRRSCEGKAKHESEGAAHYAAEKTFARSGDVVFPYLCQFCKKWHIGHNPARSRGKVHVWLKSRPKGH